MLKRPVLVVEDDPLMRMHIVEYLREQGFEVHEADHAEAALAILEANPLVRIVVTDVQMPGAMDGKALAHYVRDRWPPTILVVASGAEKLADTDLPTRSVFLSKPFVPGALLKAIERLVAETG
ncbi:response regulator [Sphingomonas lacusdianchii]|uniref:response regulator n=1 Tax=Sphingomonas lacusdianchii TaxID=2917992 RepID=UPI001F5602AE|nr:response regulator [Sphingomonas sp. JXJ CY 53]